MLAKVMEILSYLYHKAMPASPVANSLFAKINTIVTSTTLVFKYGSVTTGTVTLDTTEQDVVGSSGTPKRATTTGATIKVWLSLADMSDASDALTVKIYREQPQGSLVLCCSFSYTGGQTNDGVEFAVDVDSGRGCRLTIQKTGGVAGFDTVTFDWQELGS